jgi:hypothetical protein
MDLAGCIGSHNPGRLGYPHFLLSSPPSPRTGQPPLLLLKLAPVPNAISTRRKRSFASVGGEELKEQGVSKQAEQDSECKEWCLVIGRAGRSLLTWGHRKAFWFNNGCGHWETGMGGMFVGNAKRTGTSTWAALGWRAEWISVKIWSTPFCYGVRSKQIWLVERLCSNISYHENSIWHMTAYAPSPEKYF